jgi:hydrogenase nickel incorporation protein HypA/HybF
MLKSGMHELALAVSIAEIAAEEARRHGGGRVEAIHLRIGPLAGVVKEALLSAFPIAARGTAVEGCRLVIEDVPLVVYCPACRAERPVEPDCRLRCPVCRTPTGQIRQGRELEVAALELAS